MNAGLQEGLRLFLPLPQISGRVVPEGGDIVAGVFPPVGTRPTTYANVTYTSERNFAWVLDFVLEHWLTSEQGKPREFEHDNRSAVFQLFSVGPQNCFGTNLA